MAFPRRQFLHVDADQMVEVSDAGPVLIRPPAGQVVIPPCLPATAALARADEVIE